RHGICLFVPSHDLYAAVGVRVYLQHGSLRLRQGALCGTHHGVLVVKADAKIGAIRCWLSVAPGSVDGMVMPACPCARKVQRKQSRKRNQEKEGASRHVALPSKL